MAELLARLGNRRLPDEGTKAYIHALLAAFGQQKKVQPSALSLQPSAFNPQPLLEPLSQRELEVLQLIAQGLSNHEIGERLFLALNTVKGHNRKIFGKLQVQRRTEAVARAEGIGSTLTGMLQTFFADEVFDILGVPKDAGWYLHGVIPMGYPTGRWGVGARKPVHKKISPKTVRRMMSYWIRSARVRFQVL